ncbi:MAG: arylamine N-acetyltransferase [Cyanobacteria bacterium SZAS LIN-2]|nr:arylamine N-acetyltransferase [Cyanobacteria bacterium SZAS LIN-2]
MTVDDYLDRIGIKGRPAVNLAGLTAVHRAHMMSIPYENLDVQLGHPVSISVEGACAKIVGRKRGGWCYEMNGSMGWALEQLGFKVTRLAGAVMREAHGELALCNHLVLRVDLPEGTYLGDVGFGEGSLDPVRLVPGEFSSNGFKFSLSQDEHHWWRLHKYLPSGARSFDFKLEPAEDSCLAFRCAELQSLPESIFVQNLICYRHHEGGYYNLLGRVLRHIRSADMTDVSERLLENEDDLVTTLKEIFFLDVPEARKIWPKVMARHEEVMQEKARAQS